MSSAPTSSRSGLPRPAALGFGAAVAAVGGAWILATFTRRPWFDFAYQVPIAFVVAGGAADAFMERRARPVRGFLLTAVLAAAFTVGRIAHDWPCSGHALLGVLFAIAAPKPFWRVMGGAVALQAFVTKWAHDERPLHALYGAILGAVIAYAALRIDREGRAPKAPS